VDLSVGLRAAVVGFLVVQMLLMGKSLVVEVLLMGELLALVGSVVEMLLMGWFPCQSNHCFFFPTMSCIKKGGSNEERRRVGRRKTPGIGGEGHRRDPSWMETK
jgi:hypothetical protein